MREKKKQKSSLQESGDTLPEKEMETLASILAEPNEEHYHGNLEPFEEYVQQVKGKINGEASTFCLRFAKGYTVLLDELNKDLSKRKSL
jgi:hypothetical protein